MASTNFESANLRLLITDTAGIVTTASLQQTAASPSMDGLIQVATVTLTDAQIKALPTTSIEVASGLSQGQLPVLISFVVVAGWNFNTKYTNVNASAEFVLKDSEGQLVSSSLTESGEGFFGNPNGDVNLFYASGTRDQADAMNIYDPTWPVSIVAFANNQGDGNFTGGNPANTLKVIVYYMLVST